MKKTANRILSVFLALLMTFSCLTVAFAADEETPEKKEFTYYSMRGISRFVDNSKALKYTLDALDESLKDGEVIDIGKEIAPAVEEASSITYAVLDAVPAGHRLFTLRIDTTSIDGIMSSLDTLYDVYNTYVPTIFGNWVIIKTVEKLINLGDLEKFVFDSSNWVKGIRRKNGDQKVLEALVKLFCTNSELVKAVLGGNFSLGILDSLLEDENGNKVFNFEFHDVIVEALASSIYPYDPESPSSIVYKEKYEAASKKTADKIVYEDIIPELLTGADGFIPGVELKEDSEIDALLVNILDIVWSKYLVPELQKLKLGFDESDPLAMSFKDILRLDFTGDIPFYGDFTFTDSSFLDQVNNLLGFVLKQIVLADDFTWSYDGFSALGDNIKNLFTCILNHADFTGTEYAAEAAAAKASTNFEEKALITVKVVLAEFGGKYGKEEIQSCRSLTDMAFVVLEKVIKEEIGLDITYPAGASYQVVLADMLAYVADKIIEMPADLLPGTGAKLEDVIDYVATYFLFDRGFAKAVNLKVTKTDSPYRKLNSLLWILYSSKTAEANRLDFETILVGKNGKKSLLESVLCLDVQNILDITVGVLMDNVKGYSLSKILYSVLKNVIDNLLGASILPSYTTNALDNLIKNSTLGSIAAKILSALNKNKSNLIPPLGYLIACIDPPVSIVSEMKAADTAYNYGNAVKAPAISINGKALTENIDYEVKAISDTKKFGQSGTVTIVGINDFEGEATLPFKVVINGVQVSLDGTSFTYDGKAKKPAVKVLYNGKDLPASDYTVAYTNNVQPGLASVTCTVDKAYRLNFYINPAKVTGLKAGSIKTTSVTLSWTAVKGATNYKVYNGSKLVATVTGTKATVSSLKGNTAYSFKVCATTKASDGKELKGAYSSTVKATTAPAKTTLKASGNTTSGLTLKWSKVSGAKKYNLEKYDTSKKKWVALKSGITTTSYKVTKLSANKEYQYRITAINAAGLKGDYATLKTRTIPGAVTGVKVTPGATSATVTWKKVSGATKYQVFVNGKLKATVTKNTATITKLKTLTSYKFTVKAIVTADKVSYVGTASKAVTAKTLFTKTTGLKATKATTSSITIAWSKVKSAKTYDVYVNGKAYKTGVKTNKLTISKRKTGTIYTIKVRAISSKKQKGEFSAEIKVAAAPAKVTGLKASKVTATTVTLTWKAVKGVSYIVYQNGKKVGTATKGTIKLSKLKRRTDYKFTVEPYIKTSNFTSKGAKSSALSVKTKLI